MLPVSVPVRAISVPGPRVEKEIVFQEQTNDEMLIRGEMLKLVTLGGMELRRKGLAARKLSLVLTYSDGGRTKRTARSAGSHIL